MAAVGLILVVASQTARAEPNWREFGCAITTPRVVGLGHETPLDSELDPVLVQRQLAKAATIRGGERPGYVAFTFDDGPRPSTTRRVLKALKQYRVPATFFVVGRRIAGSSRAARESVQVLREILDEGHLVGNHTYRHDNLAASSKSAAVSAIDSSSSLIAEEIGAHPRLFRPPYGATSNASNAHLAKRGDTQVMWNIDSLDYRQERRHIMRTEVSSAIIERDGGVVLFHDTKPWTGQVLPGVLADLQRENCRRLARGDSPILPVSLHYFLREVDGTAREVPASVQRQTTDYQKHLATQCQQLIDKNVTDD